MAMRNLVTGIPIGIHSDFLVGLVSGGEPVSRKLRFIFFGKSEFYTEILEMTFTPLITYHLDIAGVNIYVFRRLGSH
jgi:hypothetical protein